MQHTEETKRVDDLKKAMLAVANYSSQTSEDNKKDFQTLVSEFDTALSNLQRGDWQLNSALVNEVKAIEAIIVETYATTLTSIATEEFNQFWDDLQKLKKVKDLGAAQKGVTDLSKDIATSVTYQIFKEDDQRKRIMLIERFVNLIDKLTTNGDFFTANAIFQGINTKEVGVLFKNDLGTYAENDLGISALSREAAGKFHEMGLLYGVVAIERKLTEQKMVEFKGPKLPDLSMIGFSIETKYEGSSKQLSAAKITVEERIKNLKNHNLGKVNDIDAVEIRFLLESLHKLKSQRKNLGELKEKNLFFFRFRSILSSY